MSRQTDNSASLGALDAMSPRLSSFQRRILDHLRLRGPSGSTDAEIERVLGINPKMNTRTRRNELVEMGLVIPTGIKRRSEDLGVVIGRTANVWAHAQYEGCFPGRERPQGLRGVREDLAQVAEDLSRKLKRVAKEIRTTDNSLDGILDRLDGDLEALLSRAHVNIDG